MSGNQDEQGDFASRRETLKRLGMLSGAVAGLVLPAVLSGCPFTWVNGEEPPVLKKGHEPKSE